MKSFKYDNQELITSRRSH